MDAAYDIKQDYADLTVEDMYQGKEAIASAKSKAAPFRAGASIIGGGVGFVVGGPTGAAIGASVGDKAVTSTMGTDRTYIPYTREGMDNYFAMKAKRDDQYNAEAIQLGTIAYQAGAIGQTKLNQNAFNYEKNIFPNTTGEWSDVIERSPLDLYRDVGDQEYSDSEQTAFGILTGRYL